jgi:heme exporter protein D
VKPAWELAVSDFFAMGGYAAFVWPAFGFAALVLIGLLAQSWWAARRRAAELEQLRRVVRPRPASRPRLRPVARPGSTGLASDAGGQAGERA